MLERVAEFLLIAVAIAFVTASLYEDEPIPILKKAARITGWLTLGVVGFSLLVQILGFLFL